MPHVPDLRAHDRHDLELVAAFAAGDATGADLELATALVGGCAECAALHADLRAIAAALPALPAPARPRDFRLTPEQAASLRPAGWRRLLATLAGPSFRFATPLGTGLAALGLAGILLGSLASVPLGTGGAATALDREGVPPAEATQLGQATAMPAAQAPSAAPAASPVQELAAPHSPGSDTAAGGAASGAPAEGSAAGPQVEDGASRTSAAGDLPPTATPSGAELLIIAGAAGLLAGLSLLALRWTSRRVA